MGIFTLALNALLPAVLYYVAGEFFDGGLGGGGSLVTRPAVALPLATCYSDFPILFAIFFATQLCIACAGRFRSHAHARSVLFLRARFGLDDIVVSDSSNNNPDSHLRSLFFPVLSFLLYYVGSQSCKRHPWDLFPVAGRFLIAPGRENAPLDANVATNKRNGPY